MPSAWPSTAAQRSQCVASALLLAVLMAAGGASAYGVVSNCSVAEIVIGQSSGSTQVEQGGADGLRVAIEEAKLLTTLPLKLKQLNHSNEVELLKNMKTLVEENCAVMIASTRSTSATEPALLSLLRGYGVPLVGSQSPSNDMRNATNSNNTASFTRSSRSVTLPFVVNIRASGSDEFNAVLSLLSHNWTSLSHVGLIVRDSTYGHWAYNYIENSLQVLLSSGTGLAGNVFLPQGTMTDSQISSFMTTLFTGKSLDAVIVCTTPDVAEQIVTWLASSGRSGTKVYIVSWVSATDLSTALSADTKALLVSKGIAIHFTQNMPDAVPASLSTATSLVRRFNSASVQRKSRGTLEGYLTGWFIYEAIQQTVARNSLPLTLGDFLYTIFEDVRTFNVQGMTLGPYGDGGTSSSTSTQSSDDACNQGVHEVFMTLWGPKNNSQTAVSGSAFKFAECMAPQWTSSSALTLIGSVTDSSSSTDATVRSGLLAAVNDHNAAGENTIVLRSMTGTASTVATSLASSTVIAVARPTLASVTSADVYKEAGVALVSPVPGLWGLRRPFQRSIINLFPSAYDEAVAAFQLLQSLGVTSVAVIRNDNSTYTEQCVYGIKYANQTGFTDVHVEENIVDAAEYIAGSLGKFGAYFVLGGALNVTASATVVRVLNSQVTATGVSSTNLYRLSVSPPLVYFSSTSDLRTEYSMWVSSEDQDDKSFESFFVGKFLAAVIDTAKSSNSGKNITTSTLLSTLYKRSVFTIEGVQIGPFKDSCSKLRDCCNQGLSTVYVLTGTTTKKLYKTISMSTCGIDYVPEEQTSSEDKTPLTLGLAVGLGGGAVLCAFVVSLVIWRTSKMVEFFNIRKGEIELGKCLGKGRFGAMYMADWHGTTVAVRVIDKKAAPKEDQRLIKEEVLLLHKHHHPNLLMLMGYCETKTDLLVVTEYMEGGCSQGDCMDAKGTVKVSDFWFSNKRGAFSSSGSGRSLKRAAWQPPEVIAGTFLTPATDVYAFGIVLWEIIAPPEMTATSPYASTSATGSEFQSYSGASSTPVLSTGMMSAGVGGVVELNNTQLGPPEIPPNASPQVAELLERCWQSQPERRPSIFQILRSWPTTFSNLGAFEVPQDLIQSAGSGNAAGLFSQHSSGSGHGVQVKPEVSGDDMASMMSIMPLKMDSVALQVPTDASVDLSVAVGNHYAANSVDAGAGPVV
eukprot:m51a1_g8839 hypothetical protein (1192) ;mRNA; r:429480-433740